MAGKKSSDGRNDNRPNGKAWKQNPGPDGVKSKPESRTDRINGRVERNHEKRERWKAAGGRADHPNIPHWKTGRVYNKELANVSNDA